MKLMLGESLGSTEQTAELSPHRRYELERSSTFASSVLQRALKRAIDIAVSGTVLLVLSPLVLIIGVAIVLDSPGPVFFGAERMGRAGQSFRMLKFRKMYDGASGSLLTTDTDPRFTRIGRWLTKTKLDELPQLWHVLRGEMSLVGPRPEAPDFVDEHPEEYGAILSGKQGITGLSQLAFFEENAILDDEDPLAHYRSRIWPQKMALDRLYIENGNVAWDLKILCWTAVGFLLGKPVAVDRQTGKLRLRRR